jgi:hypothetical protein
LPWYSWNIAESGVKAKKFNQLKYQAVNTLYILALASCVYIYKCILSRVFLQGTIDIELEKLIENQTRLENKMGNMHQVQNDTAV